ERLADVAITLADAARAFLAVTELRNLDLRQGNTDQIAALLADHFAAADVLAEIAFHLAANDLAEALVVAVDLLAHGVPRLGGQEPRAAGVVWPHSERSPRPAAVGFTLSQR